MTAFGAKGDGVTDDTAAIQAAITFVCNAYTSPTGGGSIYFPPGVYVLTQAQLPSTAAIFPLPCPGLHLIGGNGSGAAIGGAQLNRAPQTRLMAHNIGANPNGAAVFSLTYPNIGSSTFENLTIDAYNQAISMYDSNENVLRNVCLTTGATGKTDNTPLKITNGIWEYMYGGCLQAPTGSLPVAIFSGETSLNGEAPLVGLVYFDGVQGAGGSIEYIQRVNALCTGPGNFVFRNIPAMESSASSFFTITNATGNPGSTALPQFSEITFDNVTTSDASTSTNALIELNSSGTILTGVYVMNGFAGNAGQGAAVRIDAGTLLNCHVVGGLGARRKLGGGRKRHARGRVLDPERESLRLHGSDEQHGPAAQRLFPDSRFSRTAVPGNGLGEPVRERRDRSGDGIYVQYWNCIRVRDVAG